MFRKMRLWSLTSLALMLTTIAQAGISPKCLWVFYEPDIPKKLKSEV